MDARLDGKRNGRLPRLTGGAALGLALWLAPGLRAQTLEAPPPEPPASRFEPVLLGLEADYTKDAAALALRLDKPFRLDDSTLLLAEIYGAKADQGFGILSGGLALRRIVSSSGTWVGLNVFYDALRDSDGFSYSQIGVGGEVAFGSFIFRSNAYLPVGDSEDVRVDRRRRGTERVGLDASITTVEWTDTTRFSRSAAWEWEAEVEAGLPNPPEFFDPRLAVGYYIIDAGGGYARYSGLKVRGELHFGRHVSTDLEWRQDAREIGQEWRARLRFEFLLGAPSASERLAQSSGSYAGDGKGVVSIGSGKSAKSFEAPAQAADPAGFSGRVKRAPWPQVLTKTERSREITFRGTELIAVPVAFTPAPTTITPPPPPPPPPPDGTPD